MKKFLLALLVSVLFSQISKAQEIEWEKVLDGRGNNEVIYSSLQTFDGGYILAGESAGTKLGQTGARITKLNSERNIVWEKFIDLYPDKPENSKVFHKILELSDGYLILGNTIISTPNDENYGDVWIMKIDFDGNILWDQLYGGDGWQVASAITKADDGGFVIAGYSEPIHMGLNTSKVWIFKIDNTGQFIWENYWIGNDEDKKKKGIDIQNVKNGKYVVLAQTQYNSYNVFGFPNLLIIDDSGTTISEKELQILEDKVVKSLSVTKEGEYLITAEAFSNQDEGSATGILVSKTDANYQELFTKSYTQSFVKGLIEEENGYVLIGYKLTSNHNKKANIFKIDKLGNILWEETISKSNSDVFNSIQSLGNGKYLLGGQTSNKGYLLKISPDNNMGIEEATTQKQISIYPNPVNEHLYIDILGNDRIKSVSIYDISGKQIKTEKDERVINTSMLTSGVYILKIETSFSDTYTEKIIKR